jgi:predicted enzyme related to lactoylglutathione lyase
MSTGFDLVTIDTASTDRLADFWCAALDLRIVEREDVDRWLVLADRAGVRRIGLQRGTHRTGGIHLDLRAMDEFDTELRRLVGLGATLLDEPRSEPYGCIANLADPDGNPFDLCSYANGPAPEGAGPSQ